jgi:hypothetical protein
MRHLTLSTIATLLATTAAGAQKGHNWHKPTARLVTLGNYVPELHSTALTLAAVVVDTQPFDRTVADTAWQALAFAGMGSGMRSGYQKREFKTLIIWLCREQDALTKAPDAQFPNRLHRLLMALVFTRAGLDANHKILSGVIEEGLKTAMPRFEEKGATPPTTEETVLLAMLAQSLKGSEFARQQKQFLDLAKRGAAIAPRTKTRLHAAARHYVELVAGTPHPPELTIANCWPDEPLANPLHAWLGAFAVRLLPASVRKAHWQRVAPLIEQRPATGLWPGVGKRDSLRTSAMMLAVVGMCAPKAPLPKAIADQRPKSGDPWQGPIR